MKCKQQTKTLTIVGSGIAGIMCALFSARSGYGVTVVSKSPDPRKSKNADPFSSTFGGEDSRYVTLTEGHPYLGCGPYVQSMYPGMQTAFTKSIHQGGWLAQPINSYEESDRAWLDRRFRANDEDQAIDALFEEYISENKCSMQLWQELFSSLPALASGISLNSSGILRLYGCKETLAIAAEFHRRHGVLLDELSAQDILKRFPAYGASIHNGFACGALVVQGLTFRVQKLICNMLNELQSLGVKLIFDCEIRRAERNEAGEIRWLLTSTGQKLIADHYSLHLGAYDCAGLLDGVGLNNEVAGVAGGWIVLPKPPGVCLPLKVHDGQHIVNGKIMPVVDLNINPARLDDGREVLIIGGGYLFVGKPPFCIAETSRELMISEIRRVTGLVLGDYYKNLDKENGSVSSERICVRSFTPNDREIRKVIPTARQGLLTIGGGGNTGTTAKSAWIADQLVRTLREVDGANFSVRRKTANL